MRFVPKSAAQVLVEEHDTELPNGGDGDRFGMVPKAHVAPPLVVNSIWKLSGDALPNATQWLIEAHDTESSGTVVLGTLPIVHLSPPSMVNRAAPTMEDPS
jgi:hypothetical protein